MNRSVLLTLLATMCLAMHAHGSTVRRHTFALNVLGGFIQDGSEHSPYISQKYGKSFGYLHTLPSHRDRSYQPWQGTAAGIDSASLKITIDLGAETGFDLPISFHVMFYTGADSSPVKQFEILQKIPVRTNNDGKYVFIKNFFTAAERAALASGAGTLNGTFYAEVFSSFSFSGTVNVELTLPSINDCNGDGMPDETQIASGDLVDLNANGIADVCETSFNSILPASIPAEAGSLVTIRGRFTGTPVVKIGGVAVTSVTRLSSSQLHVIVPALSSGLQSVQVDAFTIPNAIHVHPRCSTDIDQDGFTDMADVSLLLLDFGPCASTLQSEEVVEPQSLIDASDDTLRAPASK